MRIVSLPLLAFAFTASAITVTSAAYADPGAEVTPVTTTTTTVDAPSRAPRAASRWYGWQTLATDGAAVALTGLSLASDGSTSRAMFGVGGLGAFVLGGPIVHAAHGRWGAAAGSLALRVVTPLGGAVVGALAGASASEDDGVVGLANAVVGMLVGFTIGTGAASAVDSAALAHEKVDDAPREDDARRSARNAPVRLVPLLSLGREGGNGQPQGTRGLVGVGATF